MSKTVNYPLPIIGIDVLSNETALVKGAVRKAINVDIGRAGRFRRRVGYQLVALGVNMHSLWVAAQRGVCLVAQADKLYRLREDRTLEALAMLNSGDPLDYVEYNGNVYWTSKTSFGWLPSDAVSARHVGVPTPEVNPTLSVGNGSLLPGKYAVAISYLDDRREEGGATEVQIIDLPQGGGIVMSGLPTKNGYTISAYISAADDSTLRCSEEFPAVFNQYVVTQLAQGGECETQFLKPLPPGEFIAWLAGRLYTAKFGTLYFSDAFRPHLYNPAHNVIPFSGYISFIAPVTNGLYVGDSRGVWFLAGTDPEKFELRYVSPHRAVRRSAVRLGPGHFPEKKVPSPNPVVAWLSAVGYVVGMDDGQTVVLQADRIRVANGLVGRTAYVLRDGIQQLITPVNSSIIAFGTAVDSEII